MINETNGRSKHEANGGMTRKEREDLAKVVRMRAKVAREAAAQRESELLAVVEEQLSARYKADHKLWADIAEAAKAFVEEADAKIAALCREHGIPENFRPGLNLSWYSRGENASAERRAELRRLAESRIEASKKAARTAITAREAELLTRVIAGGLASDEARTFLESLPMADELMPPIVLHELEHDLPKRLRVTSGDDDDENDDL
jgi:hypothetical protein